MPSPTDPLSPFLIPSQEWLEFPVESLEDIRDAEPVVINTPVDNF